ncbi:MAG: polyphosphate polymerase domain-containing protein [Actinomycetota bacterium]|nr:polyphosphate polymerase domain-containing protein [Actinomycetota bacterium]
MSNIISKRRELKYYINHIDYINLKNRLSTIFTPDKNANSEGYYLVRSLYFDNKSNNNYYEKMSGVENRNKYRIRIYNLSTSPIKLEIKSKAGNVILKESVSINATDAGKLVCGDCSFLPCYKNKTANKIYYNFTKDHYRPVVIIDYIRDAYYFDLNNIRVTFDRKIKKNEVDFDGLFKKNIDMSDVLGNSKIVMEIKYSGTIPVWIKNILQLDRFEWCAISKYTLSRYIEG